MASADIAELEQILGQPVESAEHAPWGFTNRTDVVTLSTGERVVVQRFANRTDATHRLRVMGELGAALHAAGMPTPQVIRADLGASPPYGLFEVLPGVPGQVIAGAELAEPVFLDIAKQIGTLVRRVAAVDVEAVKLPRLWAHGDQLSRRAYRWLDATSELLVPHERRLVEKHADAAPGLYKGRPAVLAHGDFGPANVLVHGGKISALLDWEFARLADPLFDVAWWSWLLRFHNPEAYERSWPAFAAVADVDPTDDTTRARIATLQVLRVLEATVFFGERGSDPLRRWAQRLSRTLEWSNA